VSCAEHRRYLAAMADGELDLVPASTVAHVRACGSCQRELRTQSLLTARLREAVAPLPARPAPPPRRRWAAAAAAAVLVAVMAAGLATWRGLGGQDRALAAASAAQAPPQFRSANRMAIANWCERRSDRPIPLVADPGLTPLGARTDQVAGSRVVTVAYRTGTGSRVTVSWLDASPRQPSVEARSDAGRTVLLVRSPAGTAVVAGDAPESTLWSVAARLQGSRDAAAQAVPL
jgi:hypothetical protein